MHSEAHADQRAYQAAVEYVREELGWPGDSYRVEFNRMEGRSLVYWAIHEDDEKDVEMAGGGNSVSLHVDIESHEVTQVLHFQ